MSVIWRPDFEIGILEIDGEHREIFARYELLLQAIAAGKGREEVVSTLNFLDHYAREHFAHEEALQRHYAYPAYELHRAEHGHFIASMDAIHGRYVVSGAQERLVKQTSQLLQEWLIQHICSLDRTFALFVATRPPGG